MSIFDKRGKKSDETNNSFSISGIDNYDTPEYFKKVKVFKPKETLEVSPSLRRNSYTNNEDERKYIDTPASNFYSVDSPMALNYSDELFDIKKIPLDNGISQKLEFNFQKAKSSVMFKKEIDKATPRIEVTRDDRGTAEKTGELSSGRREGSNSERGVIGIQIGHNLHEVEEEKIIKEEDFEEEEPHTSTEKPKEKSKDESKFNRSPTMGDIVEVFHEKTEGTDYKLTKISPEKEEDYSNILNSPSTNQLLRSYYTPPENGNQVNPNTKEETFLGITLTSPKKGEELSLEVNNTQNTIKEEENNESSSKKKEEPDKLDALQLTLMEVLEKPKPENYQTFSDLINLKPSNETETFNNLSKITFTRSLYSINNDDSYIRLLTQNFTDLNDFNKTLNTTKLMWIRPVRILKAYLEFRPIDSENGPESLEIRKFEDEIFESNLYSIIGDGRNKLCLNLITLDYLGWVDINLLDFERIFKSYLNNDSSYSINFTTKYQQVEKVLNILRDDYNLLIFNKENFVSVKFYDFFKKGFYEEFSDLKIPVDKSYNPLLCCFGLYRNLDFQTFKKILRENCLVLKLLAKFYGSYDDLIEKEFEEIFSLLSGGFLTQITTLNFFEFYRDYYGYDNKGVGMLLFKDKRTGEFEFVLKKNRENWVLRDLKTQKLIIFRKEGEKEILKNFKNFDIFGFFDSPNFGSEMFLMREIDLRESLTVFEILFENEIFKENKELLGEKYPEGKSDLNLVGNWKDWIRDSPSEKEIEDYFLSPSKSPRSKSNSNKKMKKISSYKLSSKKKFEIVASPFSLDNSKFLKSDDENFLKSSIYFTSKNQEIEIMIVEMRNISQIVRNVINIKVYPKKLTHFQYDFNTDLELSYFVLVKNKNQNFSIENLKIFSKEKIFLRCENSKQKTEIYEKSLYFSNVRSISDSEKIKILNY